MKRELSGSICCTHIDLCHHLICKLHTWGMMGNGAQVWVEIFGLFPEHHMGCLWCSMDTEFQWNSESGLLGNVLHLQVRRWVMMEVTFYWKQKACFQGIWQTLRLRETWQTVSRWVSECSLHTIARETSLFLHNLRNGVNLVIRHESSVTWHLPAFQMTTHHMHTKEPMCAHHCWHCFI